VQLRDVLHIHLSQGRFYGGKNHIKPNGNEVYPSQRNYKVSADNHARIQDVIKNFLK